MLYLPGCAAPLPTRLACQTQGKDKSVLTRSSHLALEISMGWIGRQHGMLGFDRGKDVVDCSTARVGGVESGGAATQGGRGNEEMGANTDERSTVGNGWHPVPACAGLPACSSHR